MLIVINCKMACSNQKYLLFYWNFPMMLYATQSKSDWLFSTQSREHEADWLISDNYEKATLYIKIL